MNKSHPIPDDAQDEIKWVKFWETSGSLSAEVIAGRLKTEGVPAWVWQQGAGTAMGLTYGPMGRGHVMVPEDRLEEARRIMATDYSPDAMEEDAGPDYELSDEPQDDGWLSKGILTLTAFAVSPLGVAAAFVVAKLFGGQERSEPICPDCEIMVDLNEIEKEQGWFICPECGRTVLTENKSSQEM